MMPKRTMIRLAALTFALLLTASVTLAQPPGRPGGKGGFGGGPPELLGRIADKLDLSEEQRETIGDLFDKHRDETAAMREELHGLEELVEEAIHAEPFDEEAVRAAAIQVADVRVELAIARARLGQKIRQVLTPEQRQLAAEMRERRQELQDEFSGGRGHRFGGRGPGARRGLGR